jgi:hypothetical protein
MMSAAVAGTTSFRPTSSYTTLRDVTAISTPRWRSSIRAMSNTTMAIPTRSSLFLLGSRARMPSDLSGSLKLAACPRRMWSRSCCGTLTGHSRKASGDVLYLSAAGDEKSRPAQETREGHAVRRDRDGRVTHVTAINARWLLERQGELVATLRDGRHLRIDIAKLLE